MSDAQFDGVLRWIGEQFSNGNQALENATAQLTLFHWAVAGVLLIVFGLMMMRGMGLKKNA